MNFIKYILVNIFFTLFRLFPVPAKTGLIKIGNPNENSPVFLTCNYFLTVFRLERYLHGENCFLLVANSKGYNVWCGASGGHFTNHHVISVLKTSGIEQLVNHRNVILPQLAATGVEHNIILKKTGWKIIWGPVYAESIPLFIKNGFKKTEQMRVVRFSFLQRIEMAVAWAFPVSFVLALILFFLWQKVLLLLYLQAWGLSLLIFLSFPLYDKWLKYQGKSKAFIEQIRFPLILWVVIISGLIIFYLFGGDYSKGFILNWALISFVTVVIISIDLKGSTPLYKSGFHENRLKIFLDEKKCKGTGICEQVCPRNCFEINRNKHLAIINRADQCILCGACIVQCPFNALYFISPENEIISPETVRTFKLNLSGKRLVKLSIPK